MTQLNSAWPGHLGTLHNGEADLPASIFNHQRNATQLKRGFKQTNRLSPCHREKAVFLQNRALFSWNRIAPFTFCRNELTGSCLLPRDLHESINVGLVYSLGNLFWPVPIACLARL